MQSYLTIDKMKQKQFYSIRKAYLLCLVTKTTSLLYSEIRYSIYKYTVASSARLVTLALPVADSTPGSLSMLELVRGRISQFPNHARAVLETNSFSCNSNVHIRDFTILGRYVQ